METGKKGQNTLKQRRMPVAKLFISFGKVMAVRGKVRPARTKPQDQQQASPAMTSPCLSRPSPLPCKDSP